MRRGIRRLAAVLLAGAGTLSGVAGATQITLQDGRVLSGKLGRVSGMAESPAAAVAGKGQQLIVFLDDNLRRTFFPGTPRIVKDIGPDKGGESLEKFTIHQRTLREGRTVKSLGSIARVAPFDEFGRRTITINTPRGHEPIVQGITEITPEWTKIEGITHVWDMRVATSSVSQETLATVLGRQCRKGNADDRKRIARFYLQSERYGAAAKELEVLLAEFPNDAKLKEELAPAAEAIRRMWARQVLADLELRRKSGQHAMVLGKLKKFPSEGVAGETLQAVREMIRDYEAQEKTRTETLQQLDELIEKLPDKEVRKRIEPIRKEIGEEMSLNTLERLATFRQQVPDQNMQPSEKVALALTGWFLGSKDATTKISTAISLYDVRTQVRKYLNTGDKLGRMRIYDNFQSEEGATVPLVAQLIANMKPPIETPAPENEGDPYVLEVPGLGQSPAVRYLVKLPLSYDPYRRYPAIVTLNGGGSTPELQVDWWAPQASRHGYIVVAPDWTVEHQKQYGYSAREHAAVLDSLRDACRRFSIDTDRVFLSGHSMGGDAAWDIGLAHPDIWAGVVPIVAQSDRYGAFYADNGRLLPLYFIAGEMDSGRWSANAREWDRYMSRGYNCTVVEYLGRGHENFSDETLRLFDWMGRLRRNFFPREFKCASMRPWDNFFWWIELKQLPGKAMVDPADWPPPNGAHAVETKAVVNKKEGIYITTGAGQVTVWLSPEMLDVDRRVNIVVNGHRVTTAGKALTPDLTTLLEDVRTRGDRQHPFWIKVESTTGRTAPGK